MTSEQRARSLTKVGAAAAIAFGLAAGSYGLATAASGSDSSSSSAASSNQYAAALSTPAAAPSAQNPWGGQRSDETLLTGDTAAKVKGAALAKVARLSYASRRTPMALPLTRRT